MGMVGYFAAVDAATLRQLRRDPARIQAYLSRHDDARPDVEGQATDIVTVDTAWHGIHHLLTHLFDEAAETLALAVLGGEELHGGPARLLAPEQVRDIVTWLPDETVFASRFDPRSLGLSQIYPEGTWVRDGDQARDDLLVHYRRLAAFYRRAAQRGDGAILWIS